MSRFNPDSSRFSLSRDVGNLLLRGTVRLYYTIVVIYVKCRNSIQCRDTRLSSQLHIEKSGGGNIEYKNDHNDIPAKLKSVCGAKCSSKLTWIVVNKSNPIG